MRLEISVDVRKMNQKTYKVKLSSVVTRTKKRKRKKKGSYNVLDKDEIFNTHKKLQQVV